jgi:hypothetical protein
MPNPKAGTVTTNVREAVRAAKQGQVAIRTDKTGCIKAPFGKVIILAHDGYSPAAQLSFSPEQLEANSRCAPRRTAQASRFVDVLC